MAYRRLLKQHETNLAMQICKGHTLTWDRRRKTFRKLTWDGLPMKAIRVLSSKMLTAGIAHEVVPECKRYWGKLRIFCAPDVRIYPGRRRVVRRA